MGAGGGKAAGWVRDRANATARYELGQQRKPDPRYEGHPRKERSGKR